MITEKPSKEREKPIIEAARKRFAHYGFSKVTMEEIAADAEMGKASLYYYFPTKEELFSALSFRPIQNAASQTLKYVQKGYRRIFGKVWNEFILKFSFGKHSFEQFQFNFLKIKEQFFEHRFDIEIGLNA